jgi:flagellar hook-associated protein FlgK
MKKFEVGQHLSGVGGGGFSQDVAEESDAFILKANAEAAKEMQAKAAKLKEIEEIKAILNSKEPSPALKRLTGVFTEARLEQMAKEDPYVRYILTKKYE